MVSPDDPHHAALETEVIAFAEAHGWAVGSATYHTVMPEAVKIALSRCYDPSALYVRGRADRVAVKGQHCRLFEAKTNSGRHLRASIEAGPICHYISTGIPCLYIYRDVKDGFEAAFWTTAMPCIDVVFLPELWTPPLQRYFQTQFRRVWPHVDIAPLPRTNGSNDPFVVIRRDALAERLVDWRAMFAATPPIDPPGIHQEDPVLVDDDWIDTPPAAPKPVLRELHADDIKW
jgi:hypothetical protein